MLTFLERFCSHGVQNKERNNIKGQIVYKNTEDKFCFHYTYSEIHSHSCSIIPSTLTADLYSYAQGPVSFLASLKQNHFLPLSVYCSALKIETAFPPKR
jgi:hypothetical protein